MFENILLPQTKDLLDKLKPENFPTGTYLGGGTAVALYLGHRRSEDLDFFTQDDFQEDQWQQELEKRLDFKTIQKDKRSLIGAVGKVKLSLLGYRYKLIEKKEKIYNLELASLPDLAAMKLSTVVGRGTKRDLIDIYFLAQKFSLGELFSFYQEKYGNLEEAEIAIKKGLVYFKEADQDELPEMLVPIDWKKIKNWLKKETLKA